MDGQIPERRWPMCFHAVGMVLITFVYQSSSTKARLIYWTVKVLPPFHLLRIGFLKKSETLVPIT